MKHGRRLTRDQKIMLAKAGWDPDQYLCIRELPNSIILYVKDAGEVIIFEKE